MSGRVQILYSQEEPSSGLLERAVGQGILRTNASQCVVSTLAIPVKLMPKRLSGTSVCPPCVFMCWQGHPP